MSLGDGVADPSSIPWSRAAFFIGQVTVYGEQMPPSPTRAWQIPTDAQIKNSVKNQHTSVNKSAVPQANDLVVEALTLIKKKMSSFKNWFYNYLIYLS